MNLKLPRFSVLVMSNRFAQKNDEKIFPWKVLKNLPVHRTPIKRFESGERKHFKITVRTAMKIVMKQLVTTVTFQCINILNTTIIKTLKRKESIQ